jgi:hypothetical protein
MYHHAQQLLFFIYYSLLSFIKLSPEGKGYIYKRIVVSAFTYV